jgi:hypothetical protein
MYNKNDSAHILKSECETVLCLSLSGTHSWLLSINGTSGSHYCFDVIWCTEFNFSDGGSKQEIKIWWSNHANAVNIVTEIILQGYKNRQENSKTIKQFNKVWSGLNGLTVWICVCVFKEIS